MISMIIPVIDQESFTKRCLEKLAANTTEPTELVIIDNGSEKSQGDIVIGATAASNLKVKYVRNQSNIGVLATFKQGLKVASGDILFYMHNDVLLHEYGWNWRVAQAFGEDPKLGLAGLLGARVCMPDGGRVGVMSHMLGEEWGKTELKPAALHHGELMTGIAPAAVFDGVGLIFRREALEDVSGRYNLWGEDRPLHHFYDRNISLAFLEAGYHMAVIGLKFDHYSGATANHSASYHATALKWCEQHNIPLIDNNADLTVYREAERQFFADWSSKLPAQVEVDYSVRWGR